jgi:hypothetical protein
MIAKSAALGFKLALAYSAVFVVVAAVRYGGDLAAAPPDGSLWPTYLGGVGSLAVASFGIALILGVAAAALGALTALLAGAIDRLFNPEHRQQRSAGIGLGVAALLVALLHAALWNAAGWSLPSLASAAYLFWLGAPAAIYLAAAYRTGASVR